MRNRLTFYILLFFVSIMLGSMYTSNMFTFSEPEKTLITTLTESGKTGGGNVKTISSEQAPNQAEAE